MPEQRVTLDWSWVRSVLSQGSAIQQDYAAGKYACYEEYAARLDVAARERIDEHPIPQTAQAVVDAARLYSKDGISHLPSCGLYDNPEMGANCDCGAADLAIALAALDKAERGET